MVPINFPVLAFHNLMVLSPEPVATVLPSGEIAPDQTISRAGVLMEGDSSREGESWYRGPVILSWADALAGGRWESDGDNLVLHEFAHQLDMRSGRDVDGTPVLRNRQQVQRWQRVVTVREW